MNPKVFISYSWSSPEHRNRVRQWAEQLVNDGVDAVLDVWELREGDDKYAFMERLVTDDTVTHVLMFCDAEYAEKADARRAGVGTESQIISQEVYAKTKQSKFIPVVCEVNKQGEPYLPTFLKPRIWIDFSSPEAANENWEQLIRLLYGKPIYEKPTLGKAPAYLAELAVPASPAIAKFAALRQAVLQNRPGLKLYREDFLDACYDYADALRTRERPCENSLGERVLADCTKLKLVRDHIVDWVLLESKVNPSPNFGESLIEMLEHLLELKSRPPELNTWNEVWFEAHSVFVYETFLYIIAALIKTATFSILNLIFNSYYVLPKVDHDISGKFGQFSTFLGSSGTLQILAPKGQNLNAPAAELIKRQADRIDLPFLLVMEAELLVLMMAFIKENCHWYPQTLFYASRSREFTFFLRAAQHRHFLKLAEITGVSDADALRELVRKGEGRLNVRNWRGFCWGDCSFWSHMNMEALDTLT